MASASAEADFIYEPLIKPTLIRLLKIIENNDNEPLRCELETYDLDTTDELPRYAALSYTWGYPEDRHPMLCNGKVLQITTKLDEALRKTHIHNSTKYIWVDQACINQEDLEEKGRQIQLTTTIYQTAWIVVAWLGLSDDTTKLAIEQIEKVANTWRTENQDYPGLKMIEGYDQTSLPQGEDKLTSIALYNSYEEDKNAWLALSRFFDQPWFERVWIIQEMMNTMTWGATRMIGATVVCGEHKTNWTMVHHAARWIHKARCLSHTPPVNPDAVIDGVHFTANLTGVGFFMRPALVAKTEGEFRSVGTYIWGVLNTFRNFGFRKATDPRDHIFALSGLTEFSRSTERPGVNNSLLIRTPMIPINYSYPVQATFRDFAKVIIDWYAETFSNEFPPLDFHGNKSEGPLDILLDAGMSWTDPEWPSWVPDWRCPKPKNLPPAFASKVGPKFESPQLYDPPDPNFLKLGGVILGQVDWINDKEHSSEILIDSDPRDLSKLLEERLGPSYQHGLGNRKNQTQEQEDESKASVHRASEKQESTASAFLWTLSADGVPQLFSDAGITAETYEQDEVLYKFLDLLRRHKGKGDHLFSLDDKELDFCQAIKGSLDAESVERFHGQSRAKLCNRHIFTTDTGYMGTAPLNARVGDVLALLIGMSMPVVLLPCTKNDTGEQAYRLVGDAWVRGVMNGEVIDDLNQSGGSPEVILLR